MYALQLHYILVSPPSVHSSQDLTMRALRTLLIASTLLLWQTSASPDGNSDYSPLRLFMFHLPMCSLTFQIAI